MQLIKPQKPEAPSLHPPSAPKAGPPRLRRRHTCCSSHQGQHLPLGSGNPAKKDLRALASSPGSEGRGLFLESYVTFASQLPTLCPFLHPRRRVAVTAPVSPGREPARPSLFLSGSAITFLQPRCDHFYDDNKAHMFACETAGRSYQRAAALRWPRGTQALGPVLHEASRSGEACVEAQQETPLTGEGLPHTMIYLG